MKFKQLEVMKKVNYKNLEHTIIENNGNYYFDIDGDWYNDTWCDNPLEECIKDAKEDLINTYNGRNTTFCMMEYSEKKVFNNCK